MSVDLNKISLNYHLGNGTVFHDDAVTVTLTNFGKNDVPSIHNIESEVSPSGWDINHFYNSVQSAHICVGLRRDNLWLAYGVFSLVVDEAELLTIGVAKEWQKKGLASLLLEAMEPLLAEKVNSIFLEVRESNSAAINLYEKLGFNCMGERKGYYPGTSNKRDNNQRENALMYGKDIAGNPFL